MLLERYLHTIENINPEKIYVENVRSFFKVPSMVARLMCEMAVVDSLFVKKYGIVCPNSDCRRIIESYYDKNSIPEEITCEICENEESEKFTFKVSKLEIIEFYQLNK